MTREIKFRAWVKPMIDKETGETLWPGFMDYELGQQKMIAVKTETQEIPGEIGFQHVQSSVYFINEALARYGNRLMQFTGLLDRNGKEIYEGDIVKCLDGYNAEVKWDKENTGWHPFGSYEGAEWDKSVEVIGNIYENPELLK